MSTTHPILTAGGWAQETSENTVRPLNPSTGDPVGDLYPISPLATLEQMARDAAKCAQRLNRLDPGQIAQFLDTHAGLIDERREAIAHLAHRETGLPVTPRLVDVEMDRTVDQLRQAAACARSREWMTARIDTSRDLRSMYEPLGGGVLSIGPNNFPLAYNAIAGGDFAAAIAARNPVIAKAHPLHPGTSRLLAQCAYDAALATGMPEGTVQLFYHCTPDDGLSLIRMAEVSAVGFTGSRGAGLAMKEAADKTGTPIYLELSSINPLFLLPGAVRERGDEIAGMIADSMLAASGQQCTCPGLIVLRGDESGRALIETLRDRLASSEPTVMLSADGVKSLNQSVQKNITHGAECLLGGKPIDGPAAKYEHTLLRTDSAHFLAHQEALQTEMFGVAALVVLCEDDSCFTRIARTLEGNLTGTIHSGSDGGDRSVHDELVVALRPRVGRLIHNGVPTGVSVNAATVHGGPYPATGHPGFSAVGMPTAIHRFAALRCYDRVERWALPPELRDANPTGSMARCINDRWTEQDA